MGPSFKVLRMISAGGVVPALLICTFLILFHSSLSFGQSALLVPASTIRDNSLGVEHLPSATGQFMILDPTKKFLINSTTGRPVFITGEDAWSMEVQLSDPDIKFYLSDRARRGFNAIWMGLADNTYSNNPPFDFYGNEPFDGADFTNEDPVYWARVDRTLAIAAAYGITVFADPAFVGYGCGDGYCQSYRKSSTRVLTAYGQFLGARYASYPNLVWVIGGDADPADGNVQSKLSALANGIRSMDPVHLITTESYRGYSSDDVWAGSPWLNLDALYEEADSIPGKANADYSAALYPVFMLEDWYEGEHSLTELEVRQEGYWAVLSGGTLGRFFGNYAIWNFDWTPETSDPWKKQLGKAGSVGQAWLGKLFRSREHWLLVPDVDHNVMTAGYGSGSSLATAARTSDGQTIITYIPKGKPTTVTIDMSQIIDGHSQAKCWWFSPATGLTSGIGVIATTGLHNFTPLNANDWVLVIDSRDANLGPPGR